METLENFVTSLAECKAAITSTVTVQICLEKSRGKALAFSQGRRGDGPIQRSRDMGDKKAKPSKPGAKPVKK